MSLMRTRSEEISEYTDEATRRTEGLEWLEYLIHIELMKINKGLYVASRIRRVVLHALLGRHRPQQSAGSVPLHSPARPLHQ